MKITKLFGVMALGLALAMIAACDAGEIRRSDLETATGTEIDTGGDDAIIDDDGMDTFSSTSDPGLCPGDYLLPAGEQAYFQARINDLFNWRLPLVENYLYDQIMSNDPEDAGALRYGDYAYGGEVGNLRAMMGVVFDDQWRDLFRFGMSDVSCISGAYGSRTQSFCMNDGGGDALEASCLDTVPNIMENLDDQIPIVGSLIRMAYMSIPDTYRGILESLPIPLLSPAPVLNEFVTDMEMMVVMDGVPKGFIAEFRNFAEYAWPILQGMVGGPAASISLPAGVSPMTSQAVAPGFAPWEEDEDCWLGTVASKFIVDPITVVGDNPDAFNLIACEKSVGSDNFLIFATPASIHDVLDMVDARNAGLNPASLADDQCYTQTYKALWNERMETAKPFVRSCVNMDELQSTLLGRLNGIADGFGGGLDFDIGVDFGLAKPLKDVGPLEMFMLPAKKDADMFRVGFSASLSYKTDVAASLQLYESTPSDAPAYDMRVRFGLDTSSAFTDNIASDLIFGQQIMPGMDIYDIGAQMVMMIEQLMESYAAAQ